MSAPRHPITQRFVPLHLAGDRTRRDEPPPPVIDDPALVSPLNPHGSAAVRDLLKRIANGAVEAELEAAEAHRMWVRSEAYKRKVAEAELRAGLRVTRYRCRRAPTVQRVCGCGCGATFDARPSQKFATYGCYKRAHLRAYRAKQKAIKARGVAFGGAS